MGKLYLFNGTSEVACGDGHYSDDSAADGGWNDEMPADCDVGSCSGGVTDVYNGESDAVDGRRHQGSRPHQRTR